MGTNKAENVYQQVVQIKAMGGNSDRIDTKEEFDKLSELLSKNVDKMTNEEKSYVRGLMIEYLNGEPTLDSTSEYEDIPESQSYSEEDVCLVDNTDAYTNDSQPTKCDESNPPENKLLKYVKDNAARALLPIPFLIGKIVYKAINIADNCMNTEK